VIRGLARAGFFHYARLILNGNRALHEVARSLGAGPHESVLDLGCGCGWFCRAVPGSYLGIDFDEDYLRFARWRWGSPRRRFERLRLEELGPDMRFDKAIMASVLHHLSDAEAADVLGQLARIVRQRLVVLDLEPEESRGIQTWFLDRDRGKHIRPAARQRKIIESHFRVVDQRVFRNTTHLGVHTLFTCEPPGLNPT